MESFGVVAGRHQQRRGTSGPTPKRAIRSGAVARSRDSIFSSSSASSRSRLWTRWASEESDALVAEVTGSGDLVDWSLAPQPPAPSPRGPSGGNGAGQGR